MTPTNALLVYLIYLVLILVLLVIVKWEFSIRRREPTLKIGDLRKSLESAPGHMPLERFD